MRNLFGSWPIHRLVIGSVAGLMASAGVGEARAGLIVTASTDILYQDEAIIQSPRDAAFATYWSDQANVVGWTAMKPVVRTGRFTDADGRRLVVTTVRAAGVCDISGCPVRIQTEQGERLLDRVFACNLTDDHHVSADGRKFIACDEKFPIPKRGAGPLAARKGASMAPEFLSEPPPKQNLYSEYVIVKKPSEPAFASYWKSVSGNIMWDAPPPMHNSVSTGRFMDSAGRHLTVTTMYSMAVCGMKICPIRIFTEQGDMLSEEMGCNANEFHRISSDRRYLIACDEAFRIPDKAMRAVEVVAQNPTPVRYPQPKLEKITYDSGGELTSPKEYVFNEYWKDKTGQIDWKAPVAARGMNYNSSLPSADGRALYLTTLLPPAGASGQQTQIRVFTAQHKKIMDIQVCSDLAQHGVTTDHRSFVACGELFAIPQVDDGTAIMENASPDSDAQAYVDVVLRQRSKPANAPQPIHVDSAYHNKSEMRVSEWKDGIVEITYEHPRSGLPVAQGTLLFRGIRDGVRYSGTAYTFKVGCAPAPYTVTGMKDSKRKVIVMTGAAPHRDPRSCAVLGQVAQSGHAKLVFDTSFYGDE